MSTTTPLTRRDLERQLHDLSKELELSTFINKGAIFENREMKVQLADLKAENAVLRTTEKRLTETEAMLETCQQRLKERKTEYKRLEQELKTKLTESLAANARADEWLADLDRAVSREKRKRAEILTHSNLMDAGPSTPTNPRRSRSRNAETAPGAAAATATATAHAVHANSSRSARKRASAAAAAARLTELFPEDSAGETDTPDRVPGHASTRKKRRVNGEDEPHAQHGQYDPIKDATPNAPIKTKTITSRDRRTPIQLAVVKLERSSLSPGMDGESSDEDPLGQY